VVTCNSRDGIGNSVVHLFVRKALFRHGTARACAPATPACNCTASRGNACRSIADDMRKPTSSVERHDDVPCGGSRRSDDQYSGAKLLTPLLCFFIQVRHFSPGPGDWQTPEPGSPFGRCTPSALCRLILPASLFSKTAARRPHRWIQLVERNRMALSGAPGDA
jgi:hypothetical protein